jgi:hypothetical protein
MIKSRLFIAVAAFAACFLAVSASAQDGKMYKYVDENGTVVFTEKPPADRNIQSQAIPPGPPPQGGNPYAQPATDSPMSAGQAKREEIARQSEQSRNQRAQMDAQCAAWQSEVDRLEPHRRQYFTNEEGETERMDDEERVAQVASLKQKIAANCNS